MPLHELYRAAVDPLRAVRLVRDGEFVSIEFVSADRPRPLFTLPGIAATPDHVREAARVVGGLVRRMRTVLQGADAVKALAAEFPGLKVDDLSLRQDHNGFRAMLLLTMPDGAHHRVAVGEENIAAFGDARPHGAMIEKLRAFVASEAALNADIRWSDNRVRLGGTWARADHTAHVRRLYEEAQRADPHYMEEVTQLVTGSPVFVWDNLTLDQARALGRAAAGVALQVRG